LKRANALKGFASRSKKTIFFWLAEDFQHIVSPNQLHFSALGIQLFALWKISFRINE